MNKIIDGKRLNDFEVKFFMVNSLAGDESRFQVPADKMSIIEQHLVGINLPSIRLDRDDSSKPARSLDLLELILLDDRDQKLISTILGLTVGCDYSHYSINKTFDVQVNLNKHSFTKLPITQHLVVQHRECVYPFERIEFKDCEMVKLEYVKPFQTYSDEFVTRKLSIKFNKFNVKLVTGADQ